MVGAMVWNTTDNTYTTVSAYVDSGELTLADDIMADGEGYTVYFARFTATATGYYVLMGHLVYAGLDSGKKGQVVIRVNGSIRGMGRGLAGASGTMGWSAACVVYMAANDYADIATYHDSVAAEGLSSIDYYQAFSGHRIS